MSAPTDSPAAIERKIGTRFLGRLATILAAQLGAEGMGGTVLTETMERCVNAECVVCGMQVSGADLMASALATDRGEGLTDKQRRLRQGYCARKTCQTDFYTARFLPVPGLDWNAVWDRTEAELSGNTAIRVNRTSLAIQVMQLVQPVVRQVCRPLPLAVLGAVAVLMWVRSGGRIPGISPPARVFIVPTATPTAQPPRIP
jgi:hypothetical protein